MQISLIGNSEADENQKKLAHQAGKIIAEAGATLICGGRDGVMGAACEGAK